ncbi:Zn(2)-C6 fungal-type domain-containing protein [Mycena indigotica]|uniref:Zn(2)-C6 fungal-type domain-containing protein n=1 Tax=Mycena indigotica TaxID=2126181 RepID=A0A8H6T9V7_9AGAR|nr:Zn(2)-C6 fungal-type domain-containing protein [Mycena indigotica]KAF7312612.1 Zn(2)-C6 fungal-type domain-containing protein [Mycena indigotica]
MMSAQEPQQRIPPSSDDGANSQESAGPVAAVLRPRLRREQRACDGCRRKRRVCDGTRVKGCTTCQEAGIECRFTGAPRKHPQYIEGLETRLMANEKVIRAQASVPETVATDTSPHILRGIAALLEVVSTQIHSANDKQPTAVEDDDLFDRLRVLSLCTYGKQFQNVASRWGLVATAIEQRELYERKQLRWRNRRTKYWIEHQFPRYPLSRPDIRPLVFPPHDLLLSLFDLYFRHENIYYPVLHRLSFTRNVIDGLHLRDRDFGTIVLLVCAIGAKYSADPRVLYRRDGTYDELHVGEQYFEQVSFTMDYLFNGPTLAHIQFCALASMYLQFSGPFQSTLVAMGIKIAQDRGIHRWRMMSNTPRTIAEQWKRAFWCLFCMDRQAAFSFGQPLAIEGYDMDTDLPSECDDEYWLGGAGVSPEDAPFAQPADQPSHVAFLTQFIQLNQLQGLVFRGLYSLHKCRSILAIREDRWQHRMVGELDLALDSWLERVPAHLRLDNYVDRGEMPLDDIFFDQAVMLHAAFHSLRIHVHGQFLPIVRQHTPNFNLPSSAMSTDAARAISRVLHLQRQQRIIPVPSVTPFAFTAGLILVINLWNAARTAGLSPHMNTTVDDISRLMQVLQICEPRWRSPGLFWDLLSELSFHEAMLPWPCDNPKAVQSNVVNNNNKRRRPAAQMAATAVQPVLTPFMRSSLEYALIANPPY